MKIPVLAGCAGLAATIGLAQQVELPTFLQDENLVYKGRVSDMDMYVMEGFKAIWFVAPDGKSAIAGTIFSSIGRDISAAHTGRDPIRIFEINPGPVSEPVVESDTGISLLNPDVFSKPDNSGMISPELENQTRNGASTGITSIMSDQGIMQITENINRINPDIPKAPSAMEVPPIIETPRMDSADSLALQAEAALEAMPVETRNALLRELAEMINGVKTEEQFTAVTSDWTNMVASKFHEGISVSGVDPVVEPVPDFAEVIPLQLAPSGSALQSTRQVVADVEEPSLADQLLDDIRYDGFWFGIGYPDIPVVYAFMDPACPYCAKAIMNIGDEMEQGKIQLRVVPVPVISTESPGLIASIMADDHPPEAFMEHEYAHATGRPCLENGRPCLESRDWSSLPGWMQTEILGNIDIMEKYEITGVPYFVFNTKDGVRIVPGVPEASDFATALPDPYKGFVPEEITGSGLQAN